MDLIPSPSQTLGPFFRHGLERPAWSDLTLPDLAGERIRIIGTLLDGARAPVRDGMIEIWQADAAGEYPGPASRFHGFGRACTDHEGRFAFITIKPGPVPALASGALQAPHINITVFARGLTKHVLTRMYFADCTEANAADPILRSLGAAERLTITANRASDAAATATYHFDIILQGERETVFFEI